MRKSVFITGHKHVVKLQRAKISIPAWGVTVKTPLCQAVCN